MLLGGYPPLGTILPLLNTSGLTTAGGRRCRDTRTQTTVRVHVSASRHQAEQVLLGRKQMVCSATARAQ